ncbi:MAG: hypothetical protein KKF12_05755 [Proteobacteria bacterium]|nr:hypothetical protein [Desulfobacula sp.]MBU3951365.1 hypothetical protein [Pseudomonadota bacterium]MBU4130305.1 hypothetical protein [Pseudomonadota bacterium]
MALSIQNNVSALRAFSTQVSVSANNVANSLSDDFKTSRALNTQGKDQQVTATITKTPSPGPLVEDPLKNDGSLKELSNTDIAKELVQQISSGHGFNANAKTIQTHEETIGSLLDLIG